MAACSGDSSVLEEELTCPVCLDLYRDPHLLPCGHNFCLPCLRRLKTRSERGRLRCPECRQTHRCSTRWQKNFKLANIAESFRRRQTESCKPSRSEALHKTDVPCDYCPAAENGAGPSAVKTCLKCEVSMCATHVQPHLELPAFRDHPLADPLSDMSSRRCADHDEMFRYYCVDERTLLCNACTIEGAHSGHAIKTLKNAMKDLKVYLDIQMQKTNRKIVKAERNRTEQKEIEQNTKAYRDDTDRHLDAFRETTIAHLDAFLSSLRECVCEYDMEQSSGIQQNLGRIAQDQSRLQEVRAGLEALQTQSDAFTFITDYNSSMKRLRRLLRKPLFSPDEPTLDAEPLYETMELKMTEFIAELRQHTSSLLDTVCEFEGENAEEVDEDEDEDEDEESFDEENESDAEAEEEMRSEEEEEQILTQSEDDGDYTPEEEETEEDD